MQAFNDVAIEQALKDVGLELRPNDFGNHELTEILKSYFMIATAKQIKDKWLEQPTNLAKISQ